MVSTLQYDSKKRPTASELLHHPFFKNHTISKDVYTFAAGKNMKKGDSNTEKEIESLKIGPNGITIENENVDRSPFSLDKYNQATGLRSGFSLRKKAEVHVPMIVKKPSHQEINRRDIKKKNIQDLGLMKQSVLLKKGEEYKPSYYRNEKPQEDMKEFKNRIQDPIFPYYKNENNILSNLHIPSLNPDQRKIHKPRMKEITEERPYKKYQKNYTLENPALVTSNQKYSKKTIKNYEVDFSQKRRNEDKDIYKSSDSYAKRVLNVQQLLPELQFQKKFSNDISR